MPEDVDWILSVGALGPPHGLDVLVPPPLPEMPRLPEVPDRKWNLPPYEAVQAEIASKRAVFAAKIARDQEEARALAAACKAGNVDAIRRLMRTILLRHFLPEPLALEQTSSSTPTRVSRCAQSKCQIPLRSPSSGGWAPCL